MSNQTFEQYFPTPQLNSNHPVDFSDAPSVDLPTQTTVGGVLVVPGTGGTTVHKQDFGTPVKGLENGADVTNTMLANQTLSGQTVSSFLIQPDLPRTIHGDFTDFDANTKQVTLHGLDIAGTIITETDTISGKAFTTTQAFKTVTNVVLPTATGTLKMGYGQLLGLDVIPVVTGAQAYLLDAVPQSVMPTFNNDPVLSYNTVASIVPTGSDSYVIYYITG